MSAVGRQLRGARRTLLVFLATAILVARARIHAAAPASGPTPLRLLDRDVAAFLTDGTRFAVYVPAGTRKLVVIDTVRSRSRTIDMGADCYLAGPAEHMAEVGSGLALLACARPPFGGQPQYSRIVGLATGTIMTVNSNGRPVRGDGYRAGPQDFCELSRGVVQQRRVRSRSPYRGTTRNEMRAIRSKGIGGLRSG
jgi:hypothetical protein